MIDMFKIFDQQKKKKKDGKTTKLRRADKLKALMEQVHFERKQVFCKPSPLPEFKAQFTGINKKNYILPSIHMDSPK